MDGNRRWAKKKGWMPWKGHDQGVKAAQSVVEFCLEKNIPYLSLYTFSLENFNRAPEELSYLFDIIAGNAADNLDYYKKKGVRIRFIGDRSKFPERVMPVCERVEQETACLNALAVNILFCYGARQEIVSAAKKIYYKIKTGELHEDAISEAIFQENLWTNGSPEPDLIVRTGGAHRLSNFLLYQAAYSEFYFLDCLWPEITKTHLEDALMFFNNSQRNFGV